MEPELSCQSEGDVHHAARDQYGLLSGGTVVQVPLNYARRLLQGDCPILTTAGKKLAFEIAVGMNGRIWVCGQSIEDSVLLVRYLRSMERLSEQTSAMKLNELLSSMDE